MRSNAGAPSVSPRHNATVPPGICPLFQQLLSQIFVNGSCNEINSTPVAQKQEDVFSVQAEQGKDRFECELALKILNSIRLGTFRLMGTSSLLECSKYVGLAMAGMPLASFRTYLERRCSRFPSSWGSNLSGTCSNPCRFPGSA